MGFLNVFSSAHLPELLGGMLIGFASAALLLFNGRIAGISGILGGLFDRSTSTKGWRMAFLAGLLLGGYGLGQIEPQVFSMDSPHSRDVQAMALFLVGMGVGLANGCTSGHGICGLARRSGRSLVATLIFMITALATATGLRMIP